MQYLEIILDVTIIFLLLFDILLYAAMRKRLTGLTAVLGYTYLFLSYKHEDYAVKLPDEKD